MSERPQNIYEEKKRDEAFVDDPNQVGVDYWLQERRSNRLKNLLWLLLLLLVSGGVSWVAWYYTQVQGKYRRPALFGSRFLPGERIMSFKKESAANSDLPEFEIMLNDFTDIQRVPVPEAGGGALTPMWVKQAALHVVTAEKAMQAEHYEKALDEYAATLQIFPNMERVQMQRGMIYLQLKEYQQAINCFKLAISESSVDSGAVNNLGSCYLAIKQYDRAEQCFRKVMSMDAENDAARMNLATVYMLTGQAEKAAELFDSYIQRHPDDLKASQAFATLLLDDGQWKKAAEMLMKIQQQAPELGPVYFKLGEALSHSSNKAAAIETIRKGVLLVDPKQALAWLASERFDTLRADPAFEKVLDELSASD